MDNLSTLSLSSVQYTSSGQRTLESATPFAYASNSVFPGKKEYKSIQEAGAWTSITYQFADAWEYVFLAGTTKILNPEELKAASVTNTNGSIRTRELNLNQSNVDVWGSSQMGGVIQNSTIGSSIAKTMEGGWKLFITSLLKRNTRIVQGKRN